MASPVLRLEPHAYLDWEHTQAERHEYVDGQVCSAMAGAKRSHAIAAGNVFAALHAALADGPCRAFVSDMKVRVEKAECLLLSRRRRHLFPSGRQPGLCHGLSGADR